VVVVIGVSNVSVSIAFVQISGHSAIVAQRAVDRNAISHYAKQRRVIASGIIIDTARFCLCVIVVFAVTRGVSIACVEADSFINPRVVVVSIRVRKD